MKPYRYLITFFTLAIGSLACIYGVGVYVLNCRNMDYRDYLANLREDSAFGCQTFADMAPAVLIVGDSHSYAGIDYNKLSSFFNGKTISACTLGGFCLETFPYLIAYMEQKEVYPQVLVYAASITQFIERKNKQEQIEEHRRVLDEGIVLSFGESATAVLNYIKTGVAYGKSYKQEKDELKKNEELIESLEPLEQRLYEKVALSGAENILAWKNRAASLRFTPGAEDIIDAICVFVKRHAIILYVVHVPESPFLEHLYPQDKLAAYTALLNRFSSCSAGVLIESSGYYGLGNRHFVNRKIKTAYRYEQWALANFTPGDNDIDLDHMNIVGALKFTEKLGDFVSQRDSY